MNLKRFKFDFLSSRAITVVVFIVIIYAAFGLTKVTWQNYKVNQQIISLKDSIKKADEENFNLKSKIDYYKTDSYRERQAREKLNLQKPGEIVIVIPNSPQAEEINKEEQNKVVEKPTIRSNFQKWQDYFFGK